jgi:hypothetical protein
MCAFRLTIAGVLLAASAPCRAQVSDPHMRDWAVGIVCATAHPELGADSVMAVFIAAGGTVVETRTDGQGVSYLLTHVRSRRIVFHGESSESTDDSSAKNVPLRIQYGGGMRVGAPGDSEATIPVDRADPIPGANGGDLYVARETGHCAAFIPGSTATIETRNVSVFAAYHH